MEYKCKFTKKIANIKPESSLKYLITKSREQKFKGNLENLYVVVRDTNDAKTIFNSGSFGCKEYTGWKNVQLKLNFFEAFYLLYAINCLNVYSEDNSKLLTIDECWSLFCSSDSNFIRNYIVYHHFRTKGWIIRSGEKFAGDFILYKHGPEFYHASYIVIIDIASVDENKICWNKIIPIIRVAESCKKEVIMARILIEDNISFNEIKSPLQFNKLCVHEMLVSRWTA